MKPEDAAPIDLSLFSSDTMVFDTTYGRHTSALLKQAAALGMPSSNGVPMLVRQGLGALSEWTGRACDARYPTMLKAAREALGIHD